MAGVVSWFLFKTTKGYELRASGFNMHAARYAGMSATGSIILAMTLSGGLAGLGGSMEVLGTVPQMSTDISTGFGFTAIALALLAGNRPLGIVLAALLFGALTNGGHLMGIKTGIPSDLIILIEALVIMFVAAPGLIRSLVPPGSDPDAQAVRRQSGRQERGERGMTAATPTVEEVLPGLSAADRAALRSARIRGGVMVALALLAFQYVAGCDERARDLLVLADEAGRRGAHDQHERRPGLARDGARHRHRRHGAARAWTGVPMAPRPAGGPPVLDRGGVRRPPRRASRRT